MLRRYNCLFRACVYAVVFISFIMTIAFIWDSVHNNKRPGLNGFSRVADLWHYENRRVTPKEKGFCSHVSPWASDMNPSMTVTNLSHWNFKQKVECPRINLNDIKEERDMVKLDCSGPKPMMLLTRTNDPNHLFTVNFGDKCLNSVISSCCSDDKPVPNVIHYVWYSHVEFGYFQFLSFMSALRFARPCLFLIHGPFVPFGKYWNFFIQLSPNVIHVNRSLITHVYGNKLAFKEHGSDVMRIEAVYEYGGVYLDWDQLILRPIDALRRYRYTQGMEQPDLLGSQMIMSVRNATFLRIWKEGYQSYRKAWVYNALVYPLMLSKKYPELIHVEGYNFTRPNFGQRNLIFTKNYDWSTNYGMHLFIRMYKNVTDLQIIRNLNTTIGSVSRHVLFGNKELCI